MLAQPAEEGSWKFVVAVLGSVGLASQAGFDSPMGFLIKSAVDYVVHESLGFHPNFEDALGVQIEKHMQSKEIDSPTLDLSEARFDSLIEKCESGIRALHRPVVFSQSAEAASIYCQLDFLLPVGPPLNRQTYEYVSKTVTAEDISKFCGKISSYNSNTFKGRIYLENERRTIAFELAESTRNAADVGLIVNSLSGNAVSRFRGRNSSTSICLIGFRNESSTGRLKSVYVTDVEEDLL